jgi:hypothetical protein
MRVLDDVSDIRAVILDLDASRGEAEEDAERGRAPSEDGEGAERNAAEASAADDGALDREPLHSPDHDERSEGKLEDNDVEIPAAAPTP